MEVRQLSDLLEELSQKQKVAEVNLDDIPWNTRSGWASNIKRAQEELGELKSEYTKRLWTGTLAIFATGGDDPAREAFAQIAGEEGVFVVDAADLYRRLAAPVSAAMGSQRTFTANSVPILIRAIKEVGDELGIKEIGAPRVEGETQIAGSEADVVEFVRRSVRAGAGDTLNQLYITKSVTDRAVKVRYSKSVVPIVVLGASADEVLGLMPMFSFVGAQVSLDGAEVDSNFVMNVFEEAKKNKVKKA